MASGEALVIAFVSSKERGLEWIEQMPCLKLNGRPINPKNDLMTRLYKPAQGVRDMAENGRQTGPAQGV
jgi:hypothetical protein